MTSSQPEPVEIVEPGAEAPAPDERPTEVIEQPAKIMRIGSMIRQLLEEVRTASLDERSRDRMRDIYEMSVRELASTLSPDLQEELGRLTMPFADPEPPSEAELRVAQAQLVGWLEGLFQGIQATMFAQQVMARQQLEQMRGQLGPGGGGQMMPGAGPAGGPSGPTRPDPRPGTYL